eukprot:4318771-Heterocapsa_arctica.AAC.1
MDLTSGGLAEAIPGCLSQEPNAEPMAVDSQQDGRPLDPKEAAAWSESEAREEERRKSAARESTGKGTAPAPGTPK